MLRDTLNEPMAEVTRAPDVLGRGGLGPELWDNALVAFNGTASQVSPGVYRIFTADGTIAEVLKTGGANLLTIGRRYDVRFNIDSITTLGSGVRIGAAGPIFTTVGAQRTFFVADTAGLNVKRAAGPTDIQVSGLSFRAVL